MKFIKTRLERARKIQKKADEKADRKKSEEWREKIKRLNNEIKSLKTEKDQLVQSHEIKLQAEIIRADTQIKNLQNNYAKREADLQKKTENLIEKESSFVDAQIEFYRKVKMVKEKTSELEAVHTESFAGIVNSQKRCSALNDLVENLLIEEKSRSICDERKMSELPESGLQERENEGVD